MGPAGLGWAIVEHRRALEPHSTVAKADENAQEEAGLLQKGICEKGGAVAEEKEVLGEAAPGLHRPLWLSRRFQCNQGQEAGSFFAEVV